MLLKLPAGETFETTTGTSTLTIETVEIAKRFGRFIALDGINLRVRAGELVALLGPSGSGKTTLLRIIAGLEWPDAGTVRLDGEDALRRSVAERNVGFVFQHYALFRHLSVFENVAFGLRVKPRDNRPSEAEIRERVGSLLEMVQLRWLAHRYPNQLSGGQRQRVALARALAIEPRVLLLDEPFGALDAKVRKELRRWLRDLHGTINVTSLFVTHDQEEALEVADRVVILNHGRIEQIGTPQEVYETPASAFVHDFIGESLTLPVRVDGGQVRFGGAVALDAQGVRTGNAQFFARPHDVKLVPPDEAALCGRVRHIRGFGPNVRVEIDLLEGNSGETLVEVHACPGDRVEPGQTIGIRPVRYRIFARP